MSDIQGEPAAPPSPQPASLLEAKATIGLAIVLGVIFALEVAAAHGKVGSIPASLLKRMGGNTPEITRAGGEGWRLVTAGYLHGGVLHFAMNTLSLFTIGSALEKRFGPGWLLGGFVTSVVTGSIVSALGHKPNVVAIGASGGIFGLIAMATVLAWVVPKQAPFRRDVLVRWLGYGLVLGFVGGFDNLGHAGGIVGGVVVALIASMLRSPRLQRSVGIVMGAVGALVSVAAIARAAVAYRTPKAAYDDRYQEAYERLTKALDSKDEANAEEIGRELFAIQPGDPIAQYFVAKGDAKAGDCKSALPRYRALLEPLTAEAPHTSQFFIEHNRLRVRLAVAQCLDEVGSEEEARDAWAAFCAEAPSAEDHDAMASPIERICELGYGKEYQKAMHDTAEALNSGNATEARRLGADLATRFPFDPQAQYFAGKAEALGGDCRSALPRFKMALEKPGPKSSKTGVKFAEEKRAHIQLSLLRCLEDLGEKEAAKDALADFCATAKALPADQAGPLEAIARDTCH